MEAEKTEISESKENITVDNAKTDKKEFKDTDFKLILVDLQEPLCKWFKKYFKQFPNASVVTGRFEKLPEFDCMVSAGNSFGLMDGGVDAAITLFFGDQLQKRVQQHIVNNFEGEQPVGTSFIIQTLHKKHRYLAHTPTMRVPYSIEGTDYVYLAMKAMLNAIKKHNQSSSYEEKIKSVACTGLGTFYGKMELEEAARQMALAYNNFINAPKSIDWHFASMRQQQVIYGGYQGLTKVKRTNETVKSRDAIFGEMSMLAEQTYKTNMTNEEHHAHSDEEEEDEKPSDDVEWSDV